MSTSVLAIVLARMRRVRVVARLAAFGRELLRLDIGFSARRERH